MYVLAIMNMIMIPDSYVSIISEMMLLIAGYDDSFISGNGFNALWWPSAPSTSNGTRRRNCTPSVHTTTCECDDARGNDDDDVSTSKHVIVFIWSNWQ